MPLIVSERLIVPDADLTFSAIRSPGPGGQNVNKVATAVQLRFDVRHSANLPDGVRERLEKLAGRRLTKEGVVVISAQRYRSQERNRVDAMERLLALIREAAAPPGPVRRPTRPTRAARKRRLEDKTHRGGLKVLRTRPTET